MRDALVKHTPSAAETLDSVTQGASMFLDPTGSQIGEQVQGEEGIAYAELDLMACVEPKQFHDVVGTGYQRYDVFDVRVDRRRLGPETTFQKTAAVDVEAKGVEYNEFQADDKPAEEPAKSRSPHSIGGLRML